NHRRGFAARRPRKTKAWRERLVRFVKRTGALDDHSGIEGFEACNGVIVSLPAIDADRRQADAAFAAAERWIKRGQASPFLFHRLGQFKSQAIADGKVSRRLPFILNKRVQ